jgi:hypothetical protein
MFSRVIVDWQICPQLFQVIHIVLLIYSSHVHCTFKFSYVWYCGNLHLQLFQIYFLSLTNTFFWLYVVTVMTDIWQFKKNCSTKICTNYCHYCKLPFNVFICFILPHGLVISELTSYRGVEYRMDCSGSQLVKNFAINTGNQYRCFCCICIMF